MTCFSVAEEDSASSFSSEEEGPSAVELARQVTAGMVARGAARTAPGGVAADWSSRGGEVRVEWRGGSGCGGEHRAEAEVDRRRMAVGTADARTAMGEVAATADG
jgi:hypothetical protein